MHDADILMGEKIDELSKRFEAFEKKLEPILDAYNSVIFGRKLLAGIAVIVGSLAAIGGGFYAFVAWIRHG